MPTLQRMEASGVEIDSRKVKKVIICIKWKKFNGHDFITLLLKGGARMFD